MVSNAKKEHNKIANDRKKTGGGRKPNSLKGETLKIIDLFGEDPLFSGISEGIECGSTAESLPSGSISTTFACTEGSCTQPSTTDLSCLELITNTQYTQHSSSLLNAPVSSSPGEQPTLPFVTTASTPQIQAKERAKTPMKKICFTQDIQQTQLEVLKKESQKLNLEIEHLLLAKKKVEARNPGD